MNCAGFSIWGQARAHSQLSRVGVCMSDQQTLDSLALRAKLTKVFGWSFVVLAAFFVAQIGYETFKPDEIVVIAGGEQSSYPIWPIVLTVATALFFVCVLGIMICSLLWVHRAYSNLREQDLDLTYSPGWAVGSYFVPFVNLLVPFRAMRELYNYSHGEIPEHAHSTVEDVSTWWLCYLIGLALSFGLVFKGIVDAATNIVFLTPVWMEFTMMAFSNITLIISVIMLMKVMTAITSAQQSMSYVGSAFE